MNRRGFLSLLGLGGAGLMLERSLPAPLMALAEPAPLVVPATSVLMTPAWIMKEMAFAFRESLGGYEVKYLPCEGGARLGDTIDGHTFTRMRFRQSDWDCLDEYVGVVADDDIVERVRDRHIKPFAGLLAEDLKRHNIRFLSDLPVPVHPELQVTRVTSGEYGISLRGVRGYDPIVDREAFRVGFIGAEA